MPKYRVTMSATKSDLDRYSQPECYAEVFSFDVTAFSKDEAADMITRRFHTYVIEPSPGTFVTLSDGWAVEEVKYVGPSARVGDITPRDEVTKLADHVNRVGTVAVMAQRRMTLAVGSQVTRLGSDRADRWTGTVIALHSNSDGKPNGIARVKITDPGHTHHKIGAEVDCGTVSLYPAS